MLGTWSDTNDDSVRANRPRIDTARNVADAILDIQLLRMVNYHKNHMKILKNKLECR